MMMMSKLLKAAEDKAEPVMKNSRLENDFEQLFGPILRAGAKRLTPLGLPNSVRIAQPLNFQRWRIHCSGGSATRPTFLV